MTLAYEGRDRIQAYLSQTQGGWSVQDWDSVRVITADGFELEYRKDPADNKAIEIWVPGLDKDQHVYVMYGEECMGVFSAQVFTFTELTVNVVPVNGASLGISVEELEEGLNRIYNQGVFGIKFLRSTFQIQCQAVN